MQRPKFDFASKNCFISSHSEIRGVPGLPQLSKMENFTMIINPYEAGLFEGRFFSWRPGEGEGGVKSNIKITLYNLFKEC